MWFWNQGFCSAIGNYTFENLTNENQTNKFSIRQTKLFWINLKHYSQTCSNEPLCKTTTCLRQPMLSLPKQILVQLLLCKMTTSLMQPMTTSLPKTTTKNYPAKKCERNIRNNALKINVFLIIFTLFFTVQSLFNVYKS